MAYHAQPTTFSHSIGISSFGTVQTFADSNNLFDKLPAHVCVMNQGYLDVAGVIGSYINPQTNRCLVLFSTLKLLLDTYLQSGMGFSDGQLHADFTFKLLQEQIPFLVMCPCPTPSSTLTSLRSALALTRTRR